jgi:vitamin B12 transporter
MRLSTKRLPTHIVALAMGLCVFLPPCAGFAQTQLPGIYVQGATLEAPRPASGKGGPGETAPASEGAKVGVGDADGVPLDQIGSAVTVITGAQLAAQQVRHAADALRSLPGVSVSRTGSAAGVTQVRIRGAEGNHTLVLIDGIDAGDTAIGEFDFASLLTEDIERIEVIRGPQSGLYGSKAIGGVINIVTKTGKGPFTASVRAEGGSLGTHDVSGRVSGGNDRAWFYASAQQRGAQFFNWSETGSENDPWRNTTLSLKGGVTLVKGVTLDFSLRNSRNFANTDDSPFFGLLVPFDSVATNDTSVFLGGVKLKWDTLDGAWSQVVSFNRNHTEVKTTSDLFGPSDNDNGRDKLAYLATYRFSTPTFLGASHAISGQVERTTETFTPTSAFTDGLERERNQVGVVGEYRGEYFKRLFVSANLRHDDNDTFKDFTTWRTAVSLNLPELRIRPHASVGTGVALPGMFEQFGSFLGSPPFHGNPNLQPEQSLGWDAGVELTLVKDRAFLDVTYFHANLTNEIVGFGTSLANLNGESERSGVEVALRAQLTPTLRLGASYTYLEATGADLNLDPTGTVLFPEVRRPRHAGRADLTYVFADGRGSVNLAATYNGRMQDDVFFQGGAPDFPFTTSRVTLDDYWLVDLAASYKLQKGVELFGRVENALDAQYQEVFGYNTPGITAFAGVRFTFGGPDGLSTDVAR